MARFRLVESPQGHHWVLARSDVVVAAGPNVSEAEAMHQLALLAGGRAVPKVEHRGDGWVWVLRDQHGKELGASLRKHPHLDAALGDAVLAMASAPGRECAHPKRA